MAVFKCKMCGGNLEISEGITVCKCEFCGTTQTVPRADNDKKITLFARANRLRFDCEFDKASGIYEAIIADFPEEPEAYWGLVLCKYGIEYVDDPATATKIPTCHRSSFESVMDDSNFEQVMENSDISARTIYREEAKQIEELRKGIIEVSSKEEPYDIFICYKETDENGERTVDSVLAQDVYDALTEKGYRVFFSRISLEEKLGQEYEPYIFAALNSAKVMLAFGTDYEYYNAVWVKNEWSRFLQLIAKGEKKTLIPCYKNIDAYDMPKEFAKLQAQDMGKVGAVQDLIRGIGKILPKSEVTFFNQYNKNQNFVNQSQIGDYPEVLERINGPDGILRMAIIGSLDDKNPFPKGTYETTFLPGRYNVIYFQCFLKNNFRLCGDYEYGISIYDDKNNRVFVNSAILRFDNKIDQISQGWIIHGSDGISVAPGNYCVIAWVANSRAIKFRFQILPAQPN